MDMRMGQQSLGRAFHFRSLLVTSKIVPMKFVAGLSVEVIAADDLRAHLNGTEP